MKKLPLILVGIIMPSCAVIFVTLAIGLSNARSSLDESKMAEAYSCAYVTGQYSIMNRLPSIFHGTKEPPAFCEHFKAIAVKRGFKSAAAP